MVAKVKFFLNAKSQWGRASIVPLMLMLSACGEDVTAPSQDSPNSDVEVQTEPEAAEDLGSVYLETIADHVSRVLALAPEFATVLGISEDIAGENYNARFGHYGFEAQQIARQLNDEFLQGIRSVDRESLDEAELISYKVVRNAYETGAQRNQFGFGGAVPWGSSNPYIVTQLSGPHLFLPRVLQTQQPLASEKDVDHYLSRLRAFGRVFDETIESIGADAALGVVPPYFALEGAIRSISGFTSMPPAENPLALSFSARLDDIQSITAEEKSAAESEVEAIVRDVVYPAYARLQAALESLEAQAGRDAGVWRLGEEGERFYQHALNAYGASGLTGDEIHDLGLAEVARITEEMETILQAEGLTQGTVAERFEEIGARPGMQYPNTDDGRAALLDDLRHQIEEIMVLAPEWFGTIPSQAVEVRRIPVHEQDSSAGGYYTSPSLDGSRPGIYWINLKDTADWPKHTLKTLTYHEAVPGHHFQRSLEGAAGLPLIHNMLGYSEFAEGWALYAEQVAAEMGLYEEDPFGNLGRLQSELFRAARLVVDTGLHRKQWSREEAIDYMHSVTGESLASVTREIERYAVWPGQATSYKLGMLKIIELRNKAEDALGEDFDLRAFHDEVLLTGAMPLPVLEEKITLWIEGQE